MCFMNGKYRDSVDFSFDKIEANFNTLQWIDETLKNLKNYDSELQGVSKEFSEYMQWTIQAFTESLEDDFAIPEALSTMFAFQKFANSNIREWLFSLSERDAIIDMYRTFDSVFAIIDFSVLEDQEWEIPVLVQEMFDARNQAKAEKKFEEADTLRDEILKSGYKIVDDRQGSRLETV